MFSLAVSCIHDLDGSTFIAVDCTVKIAFQSSEENQLQFQRSYNATSRRIQIAMHALIKPFIFSDIY